MVMQRIHQSTIHQVTRPNHGSRPDEPAATDARETVAQHLVCDGEEQLEGPAEVLAVEDLLGDEHVGCVEGAAGIGGVGHDDDDGVLFVVEGAGLEVEGQAEKVELVVGHYEVPAEADRVGD